MLSRVWLVALASIGAVGGACGAANLGKSGLRTNLGLALRAGWDGADVFAPGLRNNSDPFCDVNGSSKVPDLAAAEHACPTIFGGSCTMEATGRLTVPFLDHYPTGRWFFCGNETEGEIDFMVPFKGFFLIEEHTC